MRERPDGRFGRRCIGRAASRFLHPVITPSMDPMADRPLADGRCAEWRCIAHGYQGSDSIREEPRA